MSADTYNYKSLFNVLSAESIDFEDLKRELRPIIVDNINAEDIVSACISKLGPEKGRDLAQWVWNYLPDGNDLELPMIGTVLNNLETLPETQRFETLKWATDIMRSRGTQFQPAKAALSLVDTLPEAQQHHGAYELWRVTPTDNELNDALLQKAIDTVSKLPEEEQMGCIKWVCQKTPADHKLHNAAFKEAVVRLASLPDTEKFEEAVWVFAHAREGSRWRTQAHKTAFEGIHALSVEAQAEATEWVLQHAKPNSVFENQIKTFAAKLEETEESDDSMDYAAFVEKLEL